MFDGRFFLLLFCFFLSGLTALVYETAWTREFAFVFGTSELAVATVLAAYMGGLATGAALAGRLTSRILRPVWVYGLLELGIALAALAVPLAIGLSRTLYVFLFGGQGALSDASGGSATALFYVGCSFLILLVPTAMMGATLPILVRHAVREDSQIGRRVGILYAVNTIGAVAGTLLAAFVLLPAVGLRSTIWIAAGINACIFALALLLARSLGPIPEQREQAQTIRAAGRAAWILPLIFASGAVSFGYEILWVRLLTHLVGGTVHAFATMLASFLCGIALGSAIASRWASTPRRAALGFVLAQLGIAALSLAAFALVDAIPGFSLWLESRGLPKPLVDTIACMMTLLPGALCIGATFPLAVRILARRGEDAGRVSARVYTANTLGSIVGSIGAAFYLVPVLGFAGAIAALASVNLVLAALASLLFEPRRLALLSVACAGGLVLALAPPGTPWEMLRTMPLSGSTGGDLKHHAVGRSATVAIFDQRVRWNLRTNGLPEAVIIRPGSWSNRPMFARWLTALPVLARPETRSILVVGLGGGTALEVVPATVERIDVVELEPEVLEANRMLSDQRWRDPLADPRLHVHINDARNALLLAERKFDAIVSQPSHPFAGGAAHLYTQEFFELVRSRLSADGVFVQWIGLSFVDEDLFRELLASLDAVFPHVHVYRPPPGGAVLFLASGSPLDAGRTAARALASAPEDFALMGIREPEQVTARLVLDESGVRALSEGAKPNRDGHNRLQIRSARLGARSLTRRFNELQAPFEPLPGRVDPDQDLYLVLRNLDAKRAERVVEGLDDPIERKIAQALTGIEGGARERPRTLLKEVLAEAPQNRTARAALLRLSVARISQGVDPEQLLEPPLRDAELAVTEGWLARAADDSGEGLQSLDEPLAAIPRRDPLLLEAVRLRIAWRLRSGVPEYVREAVALADESLGSFPDAGTLLLRAEAYAAAEEYAAMLETLEMVTTRLDRSRSVYDAYLRQARSLLRKTPEEPEFIDLRRKVERGLNSK